MVKKRYKYRIYPNQKQQELLKINFDCCRFLHNRMLEDKIKSYEKNGKMMNVTPKMYKDKYPFLKEADSLALGNVWKDLNNAYKNYFKIDLTGHPKFKSKYNHLYKYTTYNRGNVIRIEGKKIRLPKIGYVRMVQHREFEGRIIGATIILNPSGTYYASLLIETEHEELNHVNHNVGIDLGIHDLCITSDGKKFENPKTMLKYEKKIKKLQRELARKEKGGNNYEKKRRELAKCYEKIKNTRTDYLHKISHELINENEIIVSEKLVIEKLVHNKTFSKYIMDASWGELIRDLDYKAKWNGRRYIQVEQYFPSSQLCNRCGYINSWLKNLRIRRWTCPVCGTIHDRDHNAAINILNRGLEIIS